MDQKIQKIDLAQQLKNTQIAMLDYQNAFERSIGVLHGITINAGGFSTYPQTRDWYRNRHNEALYMASPSEGDK